MSGAISTLSEALVRIEELEQENAELRAINTKLMTRLDALEARLNQNSQNSSKPPSSDPPQVKRYPKNESSGKKRGGQPGHKGHFRALLPIEQVDEILDYWPERCERCCDGYVGPRTELDEPTRHQVTELPVQRGFVVEHRLHWQWCEACEHATQAELPATVPNGAFGPRLIATIGYLSGQLRLSKRMIGAVLSDLLGVELGLGSIPTSEKIISEALCEPVIRAQQFVQSQSRLHVDETSWKEADKKTWLWLSATKLVAVFVIGLKRNHDSARLMLGGFSGLLISDRLNVYDSYALERRQVCWSHLKRDFIAMSERKGEAGKIGVALVAQTKELFRLWHRFRNAVTSRKQLQSETAPVTQQIELLLVQGSNGKSSIAKACARVLRYQPAFWTFIAHEGVDPTNNHAERMLRTAVIWRKLSFGTQSDKGSRFVERILSATQTLRLQGRDVLEWLTCAVQAKIIGARAPSLLPGLPTAQPALS